MRALLKSLSASASMGFIGVIIADFCDGRRKEVRGEGSEEKEVREEHLLYTCHSTCCTPTVPLPTGRNRSNF